MQNDLIPPTPPVNLAPNNQLVQEQLAVERDMMLLNHDIQILLLMNGMEDLYGDIQPS